jgi:hypothetical protein
MGQDGEIWSWERFLDWGEKRHEILLVFWFDVWHELFLLALARYLFAIVCDGCHSQLIDL